MIAGRFPDCNSHDLHTDKTEEAGDKIYPVYDELKRQAAQGDIIRNDDTGMKILSVIKEIDWETKNTEGKTRTGMFTTGIMSLVGDQKIALFFTGRIQISHVSDMHFHFRSDIVLHFYCAFIIDAMIANCQFKKGGSG